VLVGLVVVGDEAGEEGLDEGLSGAEVAGVELVDGAGLGADEGTIPCH